MVNLVLKKNWKCTSLSLILNDILEIRCLSLLMSLLTKHYLLYSGRRFYYKKIIPHIYIFNIVQYFPTVSHQF